MVAKNVGNGRDHSLQFLIFPKVVFEVKKFCFNTFSFEKSIFPNLIFTDLSIIIYI